MPRKKRDGFDALADAMRESPDEVLTAAGILVQHRETRLLGMMLRSAVETILAPRRKAGRPRKSEGPFDLPAALLDAAVRRRIDNVADAIVSKGLCNSEAVKAMETAARLFPAKRSRPVAFEAMKRFRARLGEVEMNPRTRTRDDRPRLYAARVVLEARGVPPSPEAGRWLLRHLQRGRAVRMAERAESLGVESVREEDVTGLLAKLDEATPKRAR